jgi:Lrp/AsnC family leucine-responsive transcriptional regulator
LKLDSIDIKILEILRKNARISISSVAQRLGMSANATRHRYKKILKSGIIKQTFIPTFLPPYTSKKKQTYKMQMTIKATNEEVEKLIKFIREFKLERSQIECWETLGHFNILAWIISENPIDLELVKDRIQRQNGVIEVKACIITNMIDSYMEVSLEHLKKEKNNGRD